MFDVLEIYDCKRTIILFVELTGVQCINPENTFRANLNHVMIKDFVQGSRAYVLYVCMADNYIHCPLTDNTGTHNIYIFLSLIYLECSGKMEILYLLFY